MSFAVVGCSHRTAPVDLRECLAVHGDEIDGVLRQLKALPGIDEVMLVSTCNRVEIYLVASVPEQAEAMIMEYLANARQLDGPTLTSAFYCHHGEEAIKHMFRVACSLDAMVVGEAQIMGQVKQSFARAERCRTVGPLLSRCMHRAFAIAKRVRTETDIARHPASLSSVAVDLAGRIFEDLSAVAVLVVGAGEMAELAVTHLRSDGACRIHVANRSLDRARELAQRFGGRALPMDVLAEQLEWADVVITSTASREPIVDRRLLSRAMKKRKQRPLLIVDIAVPRDVAKDVRSLANLYLFDVDDLEQVVAENLRARRQEAQAAERMVEGEVVHFSDWLSARGVGPLIKQLRDHFGSVAEAEAFKTARKLGLEGEQQREALRRLALSIVNKVLHAPTTTIKRCATDPRGEQLLDATRELFGLTHETETAGAISGGETSAGQADDDPESIEAVGGLHPVNGDSR